MQTLLGEEYALLILSGSALQISLRRADEYTLKKDIFSHKPWAAKPQLCPPA